ncbi:MAG: hypothetical protein AAYR31_00130 [Candidatus Vidania fulgoroideorum]
MKTKVIKYGGTSIGNIKNLKKTAKNIKKYINKKPNIKLIIVVSAMSGITNRLIDLYNKINYKTNSYLYDYVISTGERITSGILCSLIKKEKIKCSLINEKEFPIITNNKFGNAKIKNIKKKIIKKKLKKYKAIIINGFQGISKKNKKITTLGRGGSDNTAISIANKMKCKCILFKDVKGIYPIDPKIKKTNKYKKVNYISLLENVSSGSKIIQIDSLINCIKYKTKLYIVNNLSKKNNLKKQMKNSTKIKYKLKKYKFQKFLNLKETNIFKIKYKKKLLYKFIKNIEKENKNIENIEIGKLLLFTYENKKEIKKNIKKYKFKIKKISKIKMITIIGLGINKYLSNIYKLIKKLIKNNINILKINTMETKIIILTKFKNKKKLIKILSNYLNI